MTSKTIADVLLWLDVETTGLDPMSGSLLEVGMIATDTNLHRLDDGYHAVVRFDGPVDAFIARMHGANGLLDECRTGTPLGHVAVDAREYVTRYLPAPGSKYRVLLAGSSVAFDRAWMNEKLPGVLDGVHHRLFDVSTIGEAMRAWNPMVAAGAPTWGKDPKRDDRVLHCLAHSLALAAWWRDMLAGMSPEPSDRVSEADWRRFDAEANDYGVPDRGTLQTIINQVGVDYLWMARWRGWDDTEVRDAISGWWKRKGTDR